MTIVASIQGMICRLVELIGLSSQTKNLIGGDEYMTETLEQASVALRYLNRVLVGSRFCCNSTYFGQNSWT